MERHWYRSSYDFVTFPLLPLSWMFKSIVSVRRFLYRSKFKKSYEFPVPVIVVGNITVGGTGKTPFVIWLANFLRQQGLQPGIVSRGVGGKQERKPRWVNQDSDPSQVGDEAILLIKRSQCPVVIGIDRVAAVKELLANSTCNIVISDDGLQHYRLSRDIEIAIVDGIRNLGNRSLLPAGPLRESPKRLQEVDFVVRHGEAGVNEYGMTLFGNKLVSVKRTDQAIDLNQFSKVHAVAGIGNPERFFASLEKQGLTIVRHPFKDHYLYQESDFNFGDDLPIVMTEKDAVKCLRFADERFWCLPVDVQIAESLLPPLKKGVERALFARSGGI